MEEFLRAMAELTNHLPDDKFDTGIHKVRSLVSRMYPQAVSHADSLP
jgi:hypothetical protein